MLYKVVWETFIDARNPEDAAKEALEVQRDVNSGETEFAVTECSKITYKPISKPIRIDPTFDCLGKNTVEQIKEILDFLEQEFYLNPNYKPKNQ